VRRLYQSLLVLQASAADRELARMVEFLRTENRMLRERLPGPVAVTPRQRPRLASRGRGLGCELRELVLIVSYRTLCRWPAAGRAWPRAPLALRDLIVDIAGRTGLGYTASSASCASWVVQQPF
jgi:putative transposase